MSRNGISADRAYLWRDPGLVWRRSCWSGPRTGCWLVTGVGWTSGRGRCS